MILLHAFCRHSNIILIHFYWLLLLQSVLRFTALLSRILQKPVIWILSKFNRLFATWCGSGSLECRNRLLTVLYLFLFCLLILYYFIFVAFILLLIVLLYFWSYSGRYSFWTFCFVLRRFWTNRNVFLNKFWFKIFTFSC